MIFGKRLGLWPWIKHHRPYSRHHNGLQQRIAHLVKFITQHPTPPNSHYWASVKSLPTLDSAVAQLESLTGASTTSSLNAVHPPPTWLLVTLCSKVRSQADAEHASHLIVTHLPSIPPALRPPVLILVVHLLSTYRVLPALERVVRLFIGLPIFHEHWHFNRLLRALALYTDSPTDGRHMARLAVLLLKTMTERELTLTKKTYRFLLQNRYITMELTEELRQRMIRENVVPDRAHLESFLRIFAHHDSRHDDAATYVRAIHGIDRRRKVLPRPSSEETDPPDSQNPTVEYLSHLVDENAQRSQFDADAEWLRFVKKGLSPRFLNNKRNTTTASAAWAARLLSLSYTRSFSPENLVAFFEWSHAQRFPFRTHTTISYTIVLRGLLRKHAYALALDVWERYRTHGTRKLRLDLVALGVGVEVLTRAGHPDRALALIDGAAKAKPPRDRRRRRRLVASTTVPQPSSSLVTRFMRVLGVTNPSAALQLWEHMGTLYDATPDAHVFAAMLDAARHATLTGESFAGAMQELGFSRFRFRFRSPSSSSPSLGTAETDREGSLDGARQRIYAHLQQSLATDEGDMWGGERAWRRAHRIFAEALLAGWPALADVRPPARAVRASSDDPATSPLRDLKRFLAPPPPPPDHDHHDDDPPEPDIPPPPPLLPTHPRGAYPSFAPDDATFRASVLLLGTARAASEIPLVLAWMRALGLAPRARTLAYALVFWAEVSVGAPLLERWARTAGGGGGAAVGGGGGEYLRFVRWLEEWVGVGNVPDEAEVGEAMRRVDAMRRGRSSGRA